jgi:hypothetical protein
MGYRISRKKLDFKSKFNIEVRVSEGKLTLSKEYGEEA